MKNYITPGGARRLTDELNRLLKVERPKTVDDVATAAAHGDRSEIAEYKYGKLRLKEIDRRIRFLQKRLDAAVVVDPAAQEADVVFFGATIVVEDEDGLAGVLEELLEVAALEILHHEKRRAARE